MEKQVIYEKTLDTIREKNVKDIYSALEKVSEEVDKYFIWNNFIYYDHDGKMESIVKGWEKDNENFKKCVLWFVDMFCADLTYLRVVVKAPVDENWEPDIKRADFSIAILTTDRDDEEYITLKNVNNADTEKEKKIYRGILKILIILILLFNLNQKW